MRVSSAVRPAQTSLQGAHQLGQVADPLLEQVGEAVGAVCEQRVGVGPVGVLGEHDDSDVGVRRPDGVRGLDPLGAFWHPDVGDHRVREEARRQP